MRQKREGAPSFIPGRKGRTSIVDCLIKALWKVAGTDQEEWPARSFKDLRERVSKMQSYQVTSSTIRSTVYGHRELFEQVKNSGRSPLWRLTKKAHMGTGGQDRGGK